MTSNRQVLVRDANAPARHLSIDLGCSEPCRLVQSMRTGQRIDRCQVRIDRHPLPPCLFNTGMSVSNTRAGVSYTCLGVSDTRVGVANTRTGTRTWTSSARLMMSVQSTGASGAVFSPTGVSWVLPFTFHQNLRLVPGSDFRGGMGISNIRAGVLNIRLGVSDTRVGVADTCTGTRTWTSSARLMMGVPVRHLSIRVSGSVFFGSTVHSVPRFRV